jgi:hypothetical protein
MKIGKEFEQHLRIVLGDSENVEEKVSIILKTQVELHSNILSIIDKLGNSKFLTEENFQKYFGSQIDKINNLLTDDEFYKVYQFDKQQFRDMFQL